MYDDTGLQRFWMEAVVDYFIRTSKVLPGRALKTTTKNINEENRCAGRGWKLPPPQGKPQALPLPLQLDRLPSFLRNRTTAAPSTQFKQKYAPDYLSRKVLQTIVSTVFSATTFITVMTVLWPSEVFLLQRSHKNAVYYLWSILHCLSFFLL